MTAVVFVHDHCFVESGNLFYSTGKLTSRTWDRYLSSFDQVRVVATSRKITPHEDIRKLSLSSSDSVTFTTISKMRGASRLLKRQEHRVFLKRVLRGAEAVVVRLPSYLGMLAIDEAKKLGLPIGIEVVGCPFDSYRNHGSFVGKLVAPFAYARMRLVMRNTPDVAVYVTSEFLQKRYPTASPRVYEASNVELPVGLEWSSVQASRCKRWSARQHGHPIRIGFIGSLNTKYKGLEDLIRALSHVKFPFYLLVLGEGKSEALADLVRKEGLADKVEFVDPLPGGEAIANWLSTLDLYCQPSHTEGLPRALIEALAVGLICCGSRAGGIPELLADKFIFPTKNIDAIQEVLTLCSALSESESYEVAKRNFQKAASFSPAKLAQIREHAWSDLAKIATVKR